MLLKDGRTVRLRKVRGSDVEFFLGFFGGLSAKSRDFMHGWSREGACTRPHAEALAAKTDSDANYALAVLDATPSGDRMVGYCWIDGLRGTNTPMLGIGVIDEFHEAGLGKALLRRMLDEAGKLGLERVRLGVWADNPRAIHVYDSVGFRIDPQMPAKDFDGRIELYLVARMEGADPDNVSTASEKPTQT